MDASGGHRPRARAAEAGRGGPAERAELAETAAALFGFSGETAATAAAVPDLWKANVGQHARVFLLQSDILTRYPAHSSWTGRLLPEHAAV